MKFQDISVFQTLLIQETVKRSGHEERKGQLSMSWLSLDDEEIIRRFRNGCIEEPEKLLKLHKGTMCEKDLRDRIQAALETQIGRGLGEWKPPRTILAYDGRLTGHTDGSIGSTVLEVKTIPDIAILRQMKERGGIPFKVQCQVQSYIHWGKFKDGLVIYETRVEGEIWPVHVLSNPDLQQDLRQKAERIMRRLAA